MNCPNCGKEGLSVALKECKCGWNFELKALLDPSRKIYPSEAISKENLASDKIKMYCRNCGKEVTEQTEVCLGCGVPPKKGKKFCQKCGVATDPLAELCTKCGVKLSSVEGKDWIVTLLLAIFLGGLGIHRFYTGHTGSAITQIVLTFLGGLLSVILIGIPLLIVVGIWVLVDIIRIATGSFKDINGNSLIRK